MGKRVEREDECAMENGEMKRLKRLKRLKKKERRKRERRGEDSQFYRWDGMALSLPKPLSLFNRSHTFESDNVPTAWTSNIADHQQQQPQTYRIQCLSTVVSSVFCSEFSVILVFTFDRVRRSRSSFRIPQC